MRRADLAALADTWFDLVVIGGGVTGAAAAREAALRGHRVLLAEGQDFAAGTSSRSSKLVHGGLRYLQTYQFKLVAQSVRERERALAMAPHLVTIRPFLYLLYDGYPEGPGLVHAGLTFYDAASGAWRRRRHRMLTARQVLEREPHLNPHQLRGAGLYYDALTDDARYTLALVQAAAEAGAGVINHAPVTGLLLDHGQARGVRIHDQQTDTCHTIHARQVLNATGPWSDQTRRLEQPDTTAHLGPTKGVHIAVRRTDFPLGTAVFLRSPDDHRIVWPTPSREGDTVYIGTTDTPYSEDLDDVRPDDTDITYLLNAANHTIPSARLTRRDIIGSWAGLRPLIAAKPGTSAGNTPREHDITTGPSGMITIAGGKLTSSRLMAAQLVDTAERALNPRHHGRRHPAKTARTPLPGAAIDQLDTITADAHDAGVPPDVVTAWTRRYGSRARQLLQRWQQTSDSRHRYHLRGLTTAEIDHLVDHEMVHSINDLLIRRTGIFFWDPHGGLDHIEPIADRLTELLGWTPEQRQTQIDAYHQLVTQHRFE